MLLAAGTASTALTHEQTLQFVSTLGWSFALAFALLLWALLERTDREDRKKQSSGSPDRERLFGRTVVAGDEDQVEASGEAASGDPVGDAGPAEPEGPV